MIIGQFITSMDNGGAETMVVELARTIKKSGEHDVFIFTFGNVHVAKLCRRYKVKHIIIPEHIQKFKAIQYWPLFALTFGSFLNRCGVEVLHSHLYKATLMGGMTSIVSGIKHIATQHDVYTITDKPSRAKYLRWLSKYGTTIVTISKNMTNIYRDLCNIPNEKLKLIYNGIDTGMYSPVLKFKTKDSPFVFVTVGRLEKVKNIEMLLNSFVALKEINPLANIKLVIIGDGSERKKLENLVKNDSTISNNVVFTGMIGNVYEEICKADCFTMTSITEGLSMSILEAMSAGLPIVVTDVGGNYELVKIGKNGYLTMSQSYIEHAKNMEKTYKMTNEHIKEFGYHSRAIAQSKFSLESMCSNYINLYKEKT